MFRTYLLGHFWTQLQQPIWNTRNHDNQTHLEHNNQEHLAHNHYDPKIDSNLGPTSYATLTKNDPR
jgi:hypothetical protein